ncbi:MAG: 23S rRNA (cytidine(2498)-2'-O)-methyltransferase RlmM, partial [Dokdonella sp.]
MPNNEFSSLIAYCRPGFESECTQELAARAEKLEVGGYARSQRDSGLVEYVFADAVATNRFDREVAWRDLTFARQLLRVLARVDDLPRQDRLAALLPSVRASGKRYCDAWIEAPDSDAARELASLCRSLNSALITALKREHLLETDSPWRLHVCMADATTAYVAEADVERCAPWPRGIPRLNFPTGAPSRSTLKLDEALLVLLNEAERARWLKPGMTAVDLGAAPGGWTFQLVRRSIHVTAIDNGPMDTALLDSGLVTHRREDGFRYRPPMPVDWLVCDMVEKPRRVAALVGDWLASGACRMAMFNLKLPMKKRFDEVNLCQSVIVDAVANSSHKQLDWRARQLYHDREEITVF